MTLHLQKRTELGNLIIDFVNPEIIRMHCDYTTIMNDNNYDIHDDFNFLTFHRAYIERLEDWLLEKGYSKYVPLPKWTGEVAPPNEFRFVGGLDYRRVMELTQIVKLS